MSNKDNAPDLASLGLISKEVEPTDAAAEGQNEAEDAAAILLQSIKISLEERDQKIAAQGLEIRMLKGRMATMETFVSYLLEKDPDMTARMRAMAEAASTVKAPENAQG